jgi:hypothetical protein
LLLKPVAKAPERWDDRADLARRRLARLAGVPPRNWYRESLRKQRRRRCLVCKKSLGKPGAGRPRVYCSIACKQAAYLKRKINQRHPFEFLAADLAHAHTRALLRQEIWRLLIEAKLVTIPEPPPSSPPPRPNLRLIQK